VLKAIEKPAPVVLLRFQNADTASSIDLWLPVQLLEKDTKHFRIVTPSLENARSLAQLQLLEITANNSLTVQYMRRAAVCVLAQYGAQHSDVVGGVAEMFKLVLFIVGQHMRVPHARLAHDEMV